MKYWFLLNILAVCCSLSSAQVTLRFTPEQDSALIGDSIRFQLVLEGPGGFSVNQLQLPQLDSVFPPAKDTSRDSTAPGRSAAADLDLLDAGPWQVNNGRQILKGKELTWESYQEGRLTYLFNTLTFVFWETGTFLVPPPKAQVADASGNPLALKYTASTPVHIFPPDIDSTLLADDMITPIKPILREPFLWQDLQPFAIGLLALLAFGILLWWVTRRRQKEQEKSQPPPIPAHQRALQQLDLLEKRKLWQQGAVKEYHSELTRIVREYLENRYRINALETTTPEILQMVGAANLPVGLLKKLDRLLNIADLVKFAKAKPGVELHNELMEDARTFVIHTRDDRLKTRD